ncbi:hypothetical protein OROMI_022783 [Orobanche minor]
MQQSNLPLVEFAYNNNYQSTIGMALYEALYGRKCRSPLYWDGVGERKILGPEMIEHTVEVMDQIRERIKVAQDHQKSYADKRRKDLEFYVGDKVFLKVSPTKGIVRFGPRSKLRPRYIGPFEILERIGELAYRLALPPELSAVHNVLHVSLLRKYVYDLSHVINHTAVEMNKDLTYEEQPEVILDRSVRQLRNKEKVFVKIQWRNHSKDEATWEREEELQARYPNFFNQGTSFIFEDENFSKRDRIY